MGIKDKTDFNTCRLLLRSYVVQMIRKGNVHLEVQNLMKFENVHNYLLQQLRLTIAVSSYLIKKETSIPNKIWSHHVK